MNKLLMLTLSMISMAAFSAEVGEEKKSECSFSNQSSKREPKSVEETTAATEESKEKAVKTISK